MFGLHDFNWLNTGEAQIKAYVGQFLVQEQQLLSLTNSSNPTISTQAQQLYAEHKNLETQAQDLIARYQSANFTPTLLDVGLGVQLYGHIQSVNTLLQQAGQQPGSGMSIAGMQIDTSTLILGAALVIFIGWYTTR